MRLTRRAFLHGVVVVAAAVPACSSGAEAPLAATAEDGQRYFPQSVASGDPRADSVVLWARVFDGDALPGDRRVALEVATDPAFAALVVRSGDLVAAAAHDHAVKVKVTGLSPRTVYHYRFVYEAGGRRFASRAGRTKTAPAPADDAPIAFAVASCQDFAGRYYNSWQRLAALDLELDFVVFLGDYIYETADAAPSNPRSVAFTDPAAALPVGPSLAARSLSNYRDLYRAFRADKQLQAVHERYPFVFVWDDHEYANDCHGATSTYFDGKVNEDDVERRRNAEQAYFEYVPLDHPGAAGGAIDVEKLPRYPETRVYRDLPMGKNLRLVVTDYRTYRPDHLVPEDAFPGEVVMTESALAAAKIDGAFASDAFAYVDIDDPAHAGPKALVSLACQQLAAAAGLDEAAAQRRATAAVRGNLALTFVNAILTNPAVKARPIDPAGKPRGLAWVHMGKVDLFGSRGSRYVVAKDAYDAYAAYRYAATSGASEDVMGPAQRAWLAEALAGPERWKAVVTSVSLTSLVFDLRDKLDLPDPALQNRYYLNVDQWDGVPTRRRELLDQLGRGSSTIALSGDIHASFASLEGGVYCLTAPAISSESVKSGAAEVVTAAGFDETSPIYRYVVTEIDASFAASNPALRFSDADSHGFLVVEITRDRAVATFHLIPSTNVKTDFSARPLDLAAQFVQRRLELTSWVGP